MNVEAQNPEKARNSNHYFFLLFRLEILITCQNPKMAHLF